MNNKRKHRKLRKPVKVLLSFLLIFTVSVGGTLAYLSTQTGPVVNTFTPSHVDCKVKEEFSNNVKTSIKVHNTSDIEAYIRVKLVSYRVNSAEQRIGGTAPVKFKLADGWFEYGGFYYHRKPVDANDNSDSYTSDLTSNLIAAGDSIELTENYTDSDGGKQVIEVMAEAIQSKPVDAVEEAWKITVDPNGNLINPALTGGTN